ncbi:hypothetical protein DXT68_13375 [Microbacterium foliorum]|uniref:Uncharacterized protein n=1 Tax=Microbacterium foliorum TaxID=104336 RepID=A0A0F0KPI7_9MICO|nr:hypothetical protein [Microbacterium foliorum]AXL13021.1 hypothetical protein DXT68_13375 [Microbacterium foliorum]KJL22364.1 hypothetical protein RN50_01482 [Microbacterium foliorum]
MSRLSADTLLSIELGAIRSRNRYTTDLAPVVEQLLATAGDRVEVLREAVGSWIGFYEGAYTITLATTLRDLPGLEPWIAVGAARRAQADHRTLEAHTGVSWPRRTSR